MTDTDYKDIIDKIEAVKKAGFGEVRVLIKNGAVYLIKATEDKLIEKPKS
jgi:hypothetical protein